MTHDQRVSPALPRACRRFEEQRTDGDAMAVHDETVVDDGAKGQREEAHALNPIPLHEVRRDVVTEDPGVLQQLLDPWDVFPDSPLAGERNLAPLRRTQRNRTALDGVQLRGRDASFNHEPARLVVPL